jgi:ubiquitin C
MRIIIAIRSTQFFMDVGTQEKVVEIKRKIEQIYGVPVADQILTCYELELVDGLDMEDYPMITEGTKVDLAIKQVEPNSISYNDKMKMHISVKFPARQIKIEVDQTDTVRSLKEKIHIVESTPIKKMTLFFRGRELNEDFRNLNEYGIHESSEVIVFLKNAHQPKDPPSKKLRLVVQTSSSLLNGATIPLEMRDANTVKDLKQVLLGGKILPADDYLFIHRQRIMRDSCSLKWHGVENGDCLYVFKGTISRNGYATS